jgi:hypothetical protein
MSHPVVRHRLRWIDSTRYVKDSNGQLFARNAVTGRTERTARPANRVHFLAPAPPSSPAPLIGLVTPG